jgi:hypothetical protein
MPLATEGAGLCVSSHGIRSAGGETKEAAPWVLVGPAARAVPFIMATASESLPALAPDVLPETLNGEAVTLSALRGKLVTPWP